MLNAIAAVFVQNGFGSGSAAQQRNAAYLHHNHRRHILDRIICE